LSREFPGSQEEHLCKHLVGRRQALSKSSVHLPSPLFIKPKESRFLEKIEFSLIFWAVGLEGVKLTVMNVYAVYFKKEG